MLPGEAAVTIGNSVDSRLMFGGPGSRVGGCEPQCEPAAGTRPKCVPTVRTELRISCAQFAQLLRSPVVSRRWRWGAYMPARASRGPVREYAA